MYSKTLLVFLVVYLLDFSHGQREKKFFRPDYTYIEDMESFYKIHTIKQTFNDAKLKCALEGATMFYAENSDEAHAVISFWNKTQPQIPWLFVGLTDVMAEGFFETVDNTPISEVYSQFHPNQPDNHGGDENCVHMDLQAKMNDFKCDVKAYFICKKRLKSLNWNYYCDMPDIGSGYTFNKDFGKCYKVHTTPLKWSEAYGICRTERTSLAMIHTRMEADYLAKLTEASWKPGVEVKYRRGMYHMGFHNRFNEGWQIARIGLPINVYADIWFDYPPPNSVQECGSMFFNGRLINMDCDTKSLFICEHEVDTSNLSPELGSDM